MEKEEVMMNQVSLVGRVVRDPELWTLEDGNTLTKLNLAVDRYYGSTQRNEKRNEGKQTSDFPSVTFWSTQANNCVKFLKKGSLVSLQGRIATGTYVKEGETIYTTEIIGEKIQFLNNVKN